MLQLKSIQVISALRAACCKSLSVIALAILLPTGSLMCQILPPPPHTIVANNLHEVLLRDNTLQYAGLGGAGISYNNGEALAGILNPAHIGTTGLEGLKFSATVLTPWKKPHSSNALGGGAGLTINVRHEFAGLALGWGIGLSQLQHDPGSINESNWVDDPLIPSILRKTNARSLSLGLAAEYGARFAVGLNVKTISSRITPRVIDPEVMTGSGTTFDIGLSLGLRSQELFKRLEYETPALLGIRPTLDIGLGFSWVNMGELPLVLTSSNYYKERGIKAGSHASLAFEVNLGAYETMGQGDSTLELVRMTIAAEAFDDERTFQPGLLSGYHARGEQLKFWNHVVTGDSQSGITQRRGANIEILETISIGGGMERARIHNGREWYDLSRQHIGVHTAGLLKVSAQIWGGSVLEFCAKHLDLGIAFNRIVEKDDRQWFGTVTDLQRGGVYLNLKGITL